jgi:hypothetical protein
MRNKFCFPQASTITSTSIKYQLNLILSQAAIQNQQVRVFFSNLSDITNFFSNSPQRVAVLDEIVGARIPHASNTRWNFRSRTVSTALNIERP